MWFLSGQQPTKRREMKDEEHKDSTIGDAEDAGSDRESGDEEEIAMTETVSDKAAQIGYTGDARGIQRQAEGTIGKTGARFEKMERSRIPFLDTSRRTGTEIERPEPLLSHLVHTSTQSVLSIGLKIIGSTGRCQDSFTPFPSNLSFFDLPCPNTIM
jgi:hypothetical protein